MTNIYPTGRAELVESIHQPWRATVDECLDRWRMLEPRARAHSYLVVLEGADRRRTLNAQGIAELAARLEGAQGDRPDCRQAW